MVKGLFGALQVTDDVRQLLDSWRQQTAAAAASLGAAPLTGPAGYAEAAPVPAAGLGKQVNPRLPHTIWETVVYTTHMTYPSTKLNLNTAKIF